MTKVHTGASMSLHSYISGPAGTGFEHLFMPFDTSSTEDVAWGCATPPARC
jgi:hypothetical protein